MVTARVFLRPDGALEMRANGHADFDELGKDPVCAGASTLALTVAQCVDTMNEEDALEDVRIHIGGGNTRVVAKPKPEAFHEALDYFRVAAVGFQLLSEAYPEHVRLILNETAETDSEAEEADSDKEDSSP